MRTINHNLEIDAPEAMHQLCQSIIGKFLIATIRDRNGLPVPEHIIRESRGIQGYVLRLQYTVEQSRYHLTRFNLSSIERVDRAVLDAQQGSLPEEVLLLRNTYLPIIVGSTYGNNSIFFEMDATFSSLVRAGDRLVKLINAIRPLPNVQSRSLHAFVNTIKKQSQEELDKLILNYWEKYGEKIKDYRDMIEHNEHVKGDFTSLIHVSPSGVLFSSLILPDNPEVKSLENLQYNHEINAYEFLKDAYTHTVECIEGVLFHLRQLAIKRVSSIINSQPPVCAASIQHRVI